MCNPTSGGQTDLSSPHQTWRGPDLLLMITSVHGRRRRRPVRTAGPPDPLRVFHPHACAAGPNSTAGVHAIAFDNAASKCELHALDDHVRAQLHTVSMAITAAQGLASNGIATENAISAALDRPQTRCFARHNRCVVSLCES
ncbi:MAG: hypothetical protein K0Q46_5590 [Rhodococcus erythropolis]|jgi:hypothetical protein|nr:hypothetical protein [Rhodococcus erythropolis]